MLDCPRPPALPTRPPACSRCTGYRPILDAFKAFAKVDATAYTEEAIAASLASNGAHNNGTHSNGTHSDAAGKKNGASGGKVCPSTGRPCDCGGGADVAGQVDAATGTVTSASEHKDEGACGPLVPTRPRGACRRRCPCTGCNVLGACLWAAAACPQSCCFLTYDNPLFFLPWLPLRPAAELIFPPELRRRRPAELALTGPRCAWYRPLTLARLLELKQQFPVAKLVVGNTGAWAGGASVCVAGGGVGGYGKPLLLMCLPGYLSLRWLHLPTSASLPAACPHPSPPRCNRGGHRDEVQGPALPGAGQPRLRARNEPHRGGRRRRALWRQRHAHPADGDVQGTGGVAAAPPDLGPARRGGAAAVVCGTAHPQRLVHRRQHLHREPHLRWVGGMGV